MSNGRTTGDGLTSHLNGATYAKGLGGHAASDVRYALGSGCTRFKADVGVDDEVGHERLRRVRGVRGSDQGLHEPGLMTGTRRPRRSTSPSPARRAPSRGLERRRQPRLRPRRLGARADRVRRSGGTNQPPTPVIDTPASTLTWKVGDSVSFTGHATDPEQGTLPGGSALLDSFSSSIALRTATRTRCRAGRESAAARSPRPTTNIRRTSS